jgi:membrane-associated phospholipid phosphatase
VAGVLESSRPRLTPCTAALAGAIAFLAMAVWFELGDGFPGDERFLVELTEVVGTVLDDVMVAIGGVTATVGLVCFTVATAVLLWYMNRRHDALLLAVCSGMVQIVNPLLKLVFERPRPAVRVSPEHVSTFSFPSGHAAGTAGVLGGLLLVAASRRSRWVTAVVGVPLVALVAFSRLALGVHYLSDIVASWLWVGSWVCLLACISARRGQHHQATG